MVEMTKGKQQIRPPLPPPPDGVPLETAKQQACTGRSHLRSIDPRVSRKIQLEDPLP